MLPYRHKPLTIFLLVFFFVGIACFIFLTAPLQYLLGEGIHGMHSAFHGMLASLYMITSTIGLYKSFQIFAESEINFTSLKIGSIINAVASLLTIISGNSLYIPYRAAEGPRTYFLQTSPFIHNIFFEFKEYTALLTLPCAVAATYIILKYTSELNSRKDVRLILATLLFLNFVFFFITFGLGAAITKLKSV